MHLGLCQHSFLLVQWVTKILIHSYCFFHFPNCYLYLTLGRKIIKMVIIKIFFYFCSYKPNVGIKRHRSARAGNFAAPLQNVRLNNLLYEHGGVACVWVCEMVGVIIPRCLNSRWWILNLKWLKLESLIKQECLN